MKKIYQIKNKLEPVFSLTNFEIIECNTIDDLQKQTIYSDIWLINMDLNWDKELEYGLNIGVFIRKELKSCSPIIFYTSYTEKITTDYTSNQNYKYKLLQTPECYFFDKNSLANEIEKIKSTAPISNLCLEDINYFVFDAKGRIDELCHDLRNDIKEELTDKNVVLEEFKKNCIKEIESINLLKFDELFKEFKSNVIKDNKYDELTNNLKTAIYLLLPKSDDDDIDPNKEVINWQVIYLEDDEHIAEEIKKGFEENGVICHTATNEDDVIDLLEKNDDFNDENINNVTLFITDIRLKDKNGKWQKRQGYDVIEQVANRSKIPLVFAVLTSKKGTIINSTKQNLKFKIIWENKENVTSKKAFDIYFNRLKELADENFVSNFCFQPTYKSWHEPDGPNVKQVRRFKPLNEYYKDYKNQLSSDYKNSEIILNNYNYEVLKPKTEENNGESNTVSFNSSLTEKSSLIDFANKILKPRRLLLYHIFKNSEFIADLDKRNFFNKIGFSSETDKLVSNIISYYLLEPYGINFNTEILNEEYRFLLENELIKTKSNEYSTKEVESIINKLNISEEKKNIIKLNNESSKIIIEIFKVKRSELLSCSIKKEYNNLVNSNKNRNDFYYLKKIITTHKIDKKTISNLNIYFSNKELTEYINSLS